MLYDDRNVSISFGKEVILKKMKTQKHRIKIMEGQIREGLLLKTAN
jgi:hypothetical protein